MNLEETGRLLKLAVDCAFNLANIEAVLSKNPELKKLLSEYDFQKIKTDYWIAYEHPTLENYNATIKTFLEIEKKITIFQKKNNYLNYSSFKSIEEVCESGIIEKMSEKEKSCAYIKLIIGYNGEGLRSHVHEAAKKLSEDIDKILKKKKA